MDEQTLQRRRAQRAQERRRRRWHRYGAFAALLLVVAGASAAAAIALGPSGSHRAHGVATATGAGHHGGRAATRPARRHAARAPGVTIGPPTGHPGDARVPILMYHVIAAPYADSPYPGLYVPRAEFAAQMHALYAAGWRAVTLNQVLANWRRGNRLPGKPFVITFDNGYRTQLTNGLPVLRALHWVADENIQLSGLPPDQGGLTTAQVRDLVRAGWELDTQGISHADLPDLTPSELQAQVAGARRTLQRRFHVPVRWFCYPSGQYDPAVVAAVEAAGYVGSTTVVPGWADRRESPYALPRLRVLGGTTPAQLLAQITAARDSAPPPSEYLTSS